MESIHDILERIKVLEIKIGLVHKRNDDMIEVALEAVKTKFMSVVEKYVEDYLATHLYQMMEIVKDVHLKVDSALFAGRISHRVQESKPTSQVKKADPKYLTITSVDDSVGGIFGLDLLESPTGEPKRNSPYDVQDIVLLDFQVVNTSTNKSPNLISRSVFQEDAKEGIDLDDNFMKDDRSK